MSMSPRLLFRQVLPGRSSNGPLGGHPSNVLAWALWGLWLLLALVSLWIGWGGPDTDSEVGLVLVGYATVGLLVAARHPRNAVGWLFLGCAVLLTFGTGAEPYVKSQYPGFLFVAWLASVLSLLPILAVALFLPLLFPDGRLLSGRWRAVLLVGVAGLALASVGGAFSPRLEDFGVRNPVAAAGTAGAVLARVSEVGVGLVIVAALFAPLSVAVRFLRSRGVERQQLKWFTFVVMLMLLSLAILLAGEALPGVWLGTGLRHFLGGVSWTLFSVMALFGIPLATAVSIFRHHLYDIDLVINRTIVYGIVTLALLGTLVIFVLILRRVLEPVIGGSDLAVVLATLADVALFHTVRTRIQRAVDRRFYRRRYDAARILDDLAARLRHEVELDAVAADLCAAAEESMQPTHVALWMRP
jgi:hypothetical protein